MSREPRFACNLSVGVVGQDTHGNPFKQTARVENISRRGGLLTGLRCLKAPGDVIQVEHRGRKAAFRVVWIDVPSGRVGICCVDETYIWGTKLPEAQPLSSPPSSPSSSPESTQPRAVAVPAKAETVNPAVAYQGIGLEAPPIRRPAPIPAGTERPQRRYPRYRCMGGVSASAKNTPAKVWGRLSVIGLGGCYIETPSPFRPHTRVELLIGAHGAELRVEGEVRYCHSREGMGIMFTKMSEADGKELEHIIAAAGRRN